MAKYTTKRTYTKKPTGTKKVVKKIKKEVVEAVTEIPAVTAEVSKTYWQKAVDWAKSFIS